MNKRQPTVPAAKVYIREWMETVPMSQKELAAKMRRSEGTISKKLSAPERIDLQWLSEFAWALGFTVTDLFFPPPEGSRERNAKVAQAMQAFARLSDNQLDNLIAFLRTSTDEAPPPEPHPEPAAEPPSKAPTNQ